MAVRSLSPRTRFETLKRDSFTCRYCGAKSPDAILEIDHLVPVCQGGTDDPVNLITSCWDCNRGKGAVTLDVVITGQDPYQMAVERLEQQRQIKELNALLKQEREALTEAAGALMTYWLQELGKLSQAQLHGDEDVYADRREMSWLKNTVRWCPPEQIKDFMDFAILKGKTRGLRYVMACCRNLRQRQEGV